MRRVLAFLSLATAAATAADDSFFTSQIEPLLKQHCYECHSHQSGKMKNGLTLDSRSGWEQGGDSGPAVLSGKPDESLLIKMVRWTDDKHEMPPKKKLEPATIALLEEWVKRGAPDPRVNAVKPANTDNWWSLKPLIKPPLPASGDVASMKNPVDRFIRARLEASKLKPSPEADRRTLIRRVFDDLHGLPPSFAQVEAFANDPDPLAYERLVDGLLASPRYGERWARHWLDTIHFAETHGYEHDLPRDHAWRFRDYVIEALNCDTPWPRFIREQLAADRLAPDQPALTAALGFLGAGTFDHSAFTTAPVSFDYLDRDDLVTQTMSAFVSTTANCARCHTHKFDPITQEDYYALQAVFAGVVEGDITYDADPKIAVRRKQWKTLLAAVEARDKAVLLASEHAPVIRSWSATQRKPAGWRPLAVTSLNSTDGSTLKSEDDGSISCTGPRPDKDSYVVQCRLAMPAVTALRLEVLSHASLPKSGPGRQDNGNLHLSEFEATVDGGAPLKFKHLTADFDQKGWDITRAADGKLDTAWGIFPAVGHSHQAVFEFAAPLTLQDRQSLTITLRQLHGQGHLIGRFRLSATDAASPSLSVMSAEVEEALLVPESKRSEAQRLNIAAEALRAHANDEIAKLPAASQVYAAGQTAEVMLAVGKGTSRSVLKPKVVHVLKRGDFDKPMAEAKPGSLSAITALASRFDLANADDEAARRMALADWLADGRNPLTWRSIANRLWHYHFGKGLCDTPSDFGRMGGVPSHPELLDWLACELRESGGSLKHLHRLIVTSAAYRQSSEIVDCGLRIADSNTKPNSPSSPARSGNPQSAIQNPQLIDGDNRLLWRQNRHRLDADSFRDAVFASAGQLDLVMGGPSVRQFATGPAVQLTPTLDYTAYDWAKLNHHRRSIYRFIWRGIADPFMEALDFPDLGLLSPVRGFSASSLQVLTLYNNAFTLHFSGEIAAVAKSSDEAVRRLWLREPTADESREFGAYAQQYGLAALCRVLINSNEFLFVN